jgi:4-hydroxythreonine-4-phosphate dehydrogenase
VKASGLKFMGHTGAFRQLCPKSKMHMAFAGKEFNVLLASDHMALESVPKFLNKKTVAEAIKSALEFKSLLGSKKKIAILGLNPHAGESGMIGNFEKKYLSNLPKDVVGPLVPDAAFLKTNWKKYSVFICLYHDQGLIPFKLVHGQDSGVHITMGLPFIRTSVDHGTAFDLYKKNLANPASMLDAIHLNLKLIRR